MLTERPSTTDAKKERNFSWEKREKEKKRFHHNGNGNETCSKFKQTSEGECNRPFTRLLQTLSEMKHFLERKVIGNLNKPWNFKAKIVSFKFGRGYQIFQLRNVENMHCGNTFFGGFVPYSRELQLDISGQRVNEGEDEVSPGFVCVTSLTRHRRFFPIPREGDWKLCQEGILNGDISSIWETFNCGNPERKYIGWGMIPKQCS